MHHDKIALSNAAGGRNLLHHDKRAELPSRHRSNENIDASRLHLNSDLSAQKMDPGKAWNWAVAYAQEHAGRKLRANQIVMSEDIIHLPDNWAEVSGGEPDSVFFERVALPFLRGRYGYGEGGTENEISAVVHRDEVVKTGPNAGRVTPHLHWKSVPVDRNGKLSHKAVHSRKDLQALHKDFARFCAENGYPGLHVYDEERAKAREDALSMPAYKQAMEVADRAAERAAEATKAADMAETAQKAAESRRRAAEASQVDAQAKLRGLMDSVAEKQGRTADLDSEIAKKMDQKAALQADISRFSEKREKAESEAARLKQETAIARIELDNVRNDLEQDKAEIRMVEGMSYRDADGNERLGIAGMEKAYIEAQERMKAAQKQERAYLAQAEKAKADAKEWQAQADMQQRRMGMRPLKLGTAFRSVCLQIAETCLELWRYAKDAARRAWNRWMDKGLGDCADAFGVTYMDAVEASEQALHETAVAQGLERAEEDLLDMPEQEQELGYDDWER